MSMTVNVISQPSSQLKQIASVDQRLKVWAEYIAAQANGSVMTRNQLAILMECHGDFIASTAPEGAIPDYIEQTDKAVLLVKQKMPALWAVIREHYVFAEKLDDQRFNACGCSRATYYRRLAQAQHAVLNSITVKRRSTAMQRVRVRELKKAS